MPNLIFNLLKYTIFLLITALITWGIGYVCLNLLEIDYTLTFKGAVGINLILIYLANFINLVYKDNN